MRFDSKETNRSERANDKFKRWLPTNRDQPKPEEKQDDIIKRIGSDTDESSIPIKDGVAENISLGGREESDRVVYNPDGEEELHSVIAFDRAEYEKNFERPFTVSLGLSFDRDTFHKAVVKALNTVSNFKNDKRLRTKFIQWYCEQFRQPNTAFDSSSSLEKSVDGIESSINRLLAAKETPIEAPKIPNRSLGEHSKAYPLSENVKKTLDKTPEENEDEDEDLKRRPSFESLR